SAGLAIMADFIWFLSNVTAGIARRFRAAPGFQGPENRQFRPPHLPGGPPHRPAGKQLANVPAPPARGFCRRIAGTPAAPAANDWQKNLWNCL
ncbi:MAG: hypothetical protein OXM58_05675, partial [Rhodospirillaceae bacterium]|nr:hypothetical protein [Rhodospirillaceae bacterium]MDE0619086.1 hypothetical protein [Rhodospirillaceae bacterium]